MIPILQHAIDEIGLRPMIQYVQGMQDPLRPAIIAMAPNFTFHDLGHGWECPDDLIGYGDFGLPAGGVFENRIRECRAFGYQAGLMDGYGISMYGGKNAVTKLSETVEELIVSLHLRIGTSPFDPQGLLEQSLLRFHTPSPDDYRREFRICYARALHEGMEGCIAVWKTKLATYRRISLETNLCSSAD